MKKVLFICSVFISIIQVRAQEVVLKTSISENMTEEANLSSSQLKRTLKLDQSQYAKVQEINKDRFEKLATVRTMYANEPDKRDEKIEQLEMQYDAEFASVFTEKQLNEYLELNGRSGTEPMKMKVAEGPSFNTQIQSILEKATTPVPDSAQLALQEMLKPAHDSLQIALQQPENMQSLVPDSASKVTEEATRSDNKNSQVSFMIEKTAESKGKGAVSAYQDKVKLDAAKPQVKVETQHGELKMRGTKEKVETADGKKYKADAKNDKTKTQTPQRVVKFKNGREKMKPRH